MSPTMKGVKNARRKFQSQLEAVASAPCLARVRVGNVSPIRIQMPLGTWLASEVWGGRGSVRGPASCEAPDEHARRYDHHLYVCGQYERLRSGRTYVRLPIVWSVDGSLAVPAVANTKSQADCQIPPIMRGTRRPNCVCVSSFFSKRRDGYLLHDVETAER